VSALIFVRDERTLPYVPVTMLALARIDDTVRPNRRAYARSLSLALLQCAADRKRLGGLAGMSADLVTDLVALLEAAEILRVEERYHDNQRIENEYVLTEPTPLATTGHPLGHDRPPYPGDSQSESSREELEEEKDSLRSSSRGVSKVEKPQSDRQDVDALCMRLAALMRANDPKAKIPDTEGKWKRWQDAARLLIDRDERHFEEAVVVLEFSQADEFWKTNILSMPTFREKYPQLRLKWAGSVSAPRPPSPRASSLPRRT
jgi:hypothetical protein